MECATIQYKLKLLFEKVCEPGYVMNNYYADGLINKLTHDSDPEITNIKTLTMMSEHLGEAWSHIDKCHVTVRVFLTRLLAVASQHELLCSKLFNKLGSEIVKGFKEITSPNMNPSVRVAHMEVALAIVAHDTGVSWLLATGVWKEILSLCNVKQTVFVVRQTYKFASLFVWKLNDLNDADSLRNVLCHVLKPTIEIQVINMQSITHEEEETYSKTLEPMMQIVSSIISDTDHVQKPNIVINMMVKEYGVLSYLYFLIDRLRLNVALASNVAFKLVLAKMFMLKPLSPEAVYTYEDVTELSAMFFNSIQFFVQRRAATQLLDFCVACNLSWGAVEKNLNFGPDCKKLHNQLLVVCLVPFLVYVVEDAKTKYDDMEGSIREYIDKLVNFSSVPTTRAAYAVRDLTLTLNTVSVTLESVKRLACLKTHLNNEQANFVFQALFYVLNKLDPTAAEKGVTVASYDDNQETVQMMTYVLDTVLYLVTNHDINWHESLEVICLYSIMSNILKRPNLTCKFVVTALNVITQAVKKFLPPNLSLLMESRPGSSMHELGHLVYMKMHDRNWEIRDSCLELLLVCTEISFVKFPPFQKQIMENNLIAVAATLSLSDHEFYVQASALKCVGAATKVGNIWDQLLTHHPDIQEKLISILRNNQEGIVRKEACCVLREVYQNLKLSTSFKNHLYEHMVSSALGDFHWEVQLSALRFWKVVIQSFLNDQGMLDGVFPPVTFSRESRKIVTLNEAEIQKRLLKTLDELSQIGCLTVLVKLLNDDTEVEVLEAALTISQELYDILNRYKVPEVVKLNPDEIGTVEELLCYIKEDDDNVDNEGVSPQTEQEAENVIEGILKADDINLLVNIYEKQMNLKADKQENHTTPKIKLLKFASPYLFVNHMKKDFKTVIEQKKKWKEGIRSLSSLLDDILGIYEIDEEVNTLDCY